MIGRTLSHYRIVGRLAAGGMGELFRAADERLHRDVALEVHPLMLGCAHLPPFGCVRDDPRLAELLRRTRFPRGPGPDPPTET